MTVHIILSNSTDSVVISDSRMSGKGTKSDIRQKLQPIKTAHYHGFVYGTGKSDKITLGYEKAKEFPGEEIKGLSDSLSHFFRETLEYSLRQSYASRLSEFGTASEVFDRLQKRKKTKAHLIKTIQQDERELILENEAKLQVLAYEKRSDSVQLYEVTRKDVEKRPTEFSGIGGGFRIARLYLESKMQGLDIKSLSTASLLFYLSSAYAFCNIDEGVGGTPNIGVVNKRENKILPLEITLPIVNIAGAYLAELDETFFSKARTISHIEEILSGKADLHRIARRLGLTKEGLVSTHIPFSSFQERANRESQKW